MCCSDEGVDVQLPLQVLCDDGPQEVEKVQGVEWGVIRGEKGGKEGLGYSRNLQSSPLLSESLTPD